MSTQYLGNLGSDLPARAGSSFAPLDVAVTRSESVSQCTVRSHCRATKGTECPITRVILVCNKPAPCCQGMGGGPPSPHNVAEVESSPYAYAPHGISFMFRPVHGRSILAPAFDLFNPSATLFQQAATTLQPLSLYVRLIRPWLSRRLASSRELLLDPRAAFLSVFFFSLLFLYLALPSSYHSSTPLSF